jgi:hypothetical protein
MPRHTTCWAATSVLTHGWGWGGLVPLAGIAGSLVVDGAITAAAVEIADLTGLAVVSGCDARAP